MERLEPNIDEILFDNLRPNKRFAFDFRPSLQSCEGLTIELGVLRISNLKLKGTLKAFGESGWLLKAHLGASVTQSCVITLQPVKTRIEASVVRKFLKISETNDINLGCHEDIRLQQDETTEPLGTGVNLPELLKETLLLELPLYPKAKGANLTTVSFTAAGVKPMTDEDTKPFASLASLKSKLTK